MATQRLDYWQRWQQGEDMVDKTSMTNDVIAYVYGLARRAGGTGYRQWREIWVRATAVEVRDGGRTLVATSDYGETWEFMAAFVRRLTWLDT